MSDLIKVMEFDMEICEENVSNSQHNCSKCKNMNCPRRSAPFTGEILSDYVYKAENNGETIICVDIGTTTLASELVENGTVTASHTELNTQRRFGADVLSRIEAANRGRGGELQQIIRCQLLNGVKKLAQTKQIDKIIIAANTTMVYLLMGYPCEELGAYPFAASHLETLETTFKEVAPNSFIDAKTVIIGGLSAFVGGDIASGLYMCDFDLSEKVNLFVDLGTNGEMAIGNKDKIIVTSTAAGPAFEGGRIGLGLCGSDVIKAVSELLENGIIDKTGLLCEEYFENGYPVTDKAILTQNDIREVQMAKSAIRSGIDTLIQRSGIKEADIDTLFLAGGFGHGLDIKKACNIGLIPSKLSDKVKIIGNSSLGGAVRYAHEDGTDRLVRMREIAEEIQLGNDEMFNKIYIENMNF